MLQRTMYRVQPSIDCSTMEKSMRSLLTALALASLIATPALAKSVSHHVPRHLYMYQNEAAPAATQNDPPSVVKRGYLMTDPDPSIRSEIIRGYDAGSTD
jgi:hypothetical protein